MAFDTTHTPPARRASPVDAALLALDAQLSTPLPEQTPAEIAAAFTKLAQDVEAGIATRAARWFDFRHMNAEAVDAADAGSRKTAAMYRRLAAEALGRDAAVSR